MNFNDIHSMLNIEPRTYRLVAERLHDAIGSSDFYSGTIAVSDAEFDYQLRVTVIVYRHGGDPDSSRRPITDLVPVWWEFHSFDPDGERLNDFDFALLRAEMID